MSDMEIRRTGEDPATLRAQKKLEKSLEKISPEQAQRLKELTETVNAAVGPAEGAPPSRTVVQFQAKLEQEPTDPRMVQLIKNLKDQKDQRQSGTSLTGRGTAPAA